MEILLEEVESKRLTSPYSLVSFTEFNKLLKSISFFIIFVLLLSHLHFIYVYLLPESKTGEIKLEGKKYKVFVPCPSNKFRVNEVINY